MGYENNGLLLFRYGERAEEIKQQAMAGWPEISPEVMAYFAGEVLASGVVLWALINNTGLDAMRWPGDLPVVLGLKVASGSEMNIGQQLDEMAQKAGLLGAEVDQLKQSFLDMLEWMVVDQLHTSLFADQRAKLSALLKRSTFSIADRGKMLDELSTFLRESGIYAADAQSFFEKALASSLGEVRSTFGSLSG